MQSTYPYKVYSTSSPITHHQLLQMLPLLQIYYNKHNRKCDWMVLDRPDSVFHLKDRRDWTDGCKKTIRHPDTIYGKFWVYRQNNGWTDKTCDSVLWQLWYMFMLINCSFILSQSPVDGTGLALTQKTGENGANRALCLHELTFQYFHWTWLKNCQ